MKRKYRNDNGEIIICCCLWSLQALIKFKNYFYFEERDEQVDEFEKVLLVVTY